MLCVGTNGKSLLRKFSLVMLSRLKVIQDENLCEKKTCQTCKSGSWGWTLGRVHDPPPRQTLLCSSSKDLQTVLNLSISYHMFVFDSPMQGIFQNAIREIRWKSDRIFHPQFLPTNCPHYIVFCGVQSTPRIVNVFMWSMRCNHNIQKPLKF